MATNEELPIKSVQTTIKTILIVEDDPSIGEMFVQTLADESIYHPILATSGAQALELAEDIVPDLLLLDYHLPTMNGLELYDTLQNSPQFSNIPTILITAGVLQHDIGNRHIVGMSKPVDINKLLDIISELLD